MSKTENSYLTYSLPTLEAMAYYYSIKLGNGQTELANGENLGEAYEQVLEAIEQRRKTDFCKHGVFLYGDYDLTCLACEYGGE
jgi:hypothetical protein